MFNDVLKEVTGLLARRFLLNVFFPCLIFCGLLIVVVIIGAGGDLVKITGAWSQQDTGLKVLQIAGFLSVVTVFAGIIDVQLPTIIRFYEGYPPLNRYLAIIGKHFHQNRLQKLGKEEAKYYGYLHSYYPSHRDPKQAMPTQFGNIIKNSEQYPKEHYSVDAIVIWPRLYHLFPDRFIQIIAEAKSSVDFMLVISTLSGLFAIISGGCLLYVKASGWLFLACFWGGLFIAWLAYRGALASAVLYAQQIKIGFDLYRQQLFKQMRLESPDNLKNEKVQWKNIYAFLYQNSPLVSWEYIISSNEDRSSDANKKE